MKIRKAKRKDLKAVSNIFREEFRKPPYREKWTNKDAIERIKNYFKISSIFVLEKQKKIIGFVILKIYKLWGNELKGSIDEIVISSKFQGKGAGSFLMKYIENYFTKKKIKTITCVSNKKSKAFKFYKKGKFIINKNTIFMEKKI